MVFNEKYKAFLDVEDEDKEIVLSLIQNFQKTVKTPRVFFTLKLSKIESQEKTNKLINAKISKFMDDYIEGNLKVVIKGVKANKNKDQEIYEGIMNLGWNVKIQLKMKTKIFWKQFMKTEISIYYLIWMKLKMREMGNIWKSL
ncbi:unnamed protein product [Meloidogyne enterolobii]|uniref:Uncharacterized protein n=1 Tax=Meloidogyne enterolobii TaxID=390850 RepID=A0ACB0YGG1_MELEN